MEIGFTVDERHISNSPYSIETKVCSNATYYCPQSENCISFNAPCASLKICPPNSPYMCFDLECVSYPLQCSCPTFMKRCSDFSCAEICVSEDKCLTGETYNSSYNICPLVPIGHPGSFLCQNTFNYVSRIEDCVKYNMNECYNQNMLQCWNTHQCVTELSQCHSPFRCPKNISKLPCISGSCVTHPSLCTPLQNCERITCWDGSCVNSYNDCTNYPQVPEEITLYHHYQILEDFPSSCPNGLIKCPLGSCENSLYSCPRSVYCPYSMLLCSNGKCAYERYQCSSALCSPGKFRCPQSDHCVADLKECLSTAQCPKDSFLLANGTCLIEKPNSIEIPNLFVSNLHKCEDGSMTHNQKLCSGKKCPALFPVLCDEKCYFEISLCNITACSKYGQIKCRDGRCVKTPANCYDSVSCNNDEMKCWDGSCYVKSVFSEQK